LIIARGVKQAALLSLQVLGTVKNTLLVMFGAVFMHETVTALQSVGYIVSLVGFLW
jgi:hypothetical protein